MGSNIKIKCQFKIKSPVLRMRYQMMRPRISNTTKATLPMIILRELTQSTVIRFQEMTHVKVSTHHAVNNKLSTLKMSTIIISAVDAQM